MNIVIVGAGFGGIKTAVDLSKDKRFKITLISDKDHFLYYPALYGTATGHSHLESVVPLTEVFKDFSNIRIIQDTVTDIDPDRKYIIGKTGKYHYDTAIIGMGVVTTFFGIQGLEKNSFGIKSLAEVKRLKNHLHEELVKDRHMDKNYIVVGAGPTGVELSAALATYLERIAQSHKIRHSRINILLIEAAPRVLPRMSEKASRIVSNRLEKLGVQVRTNSKVEAASEDDITVNGKDIASHTIIWTSGVTNHPFFKAHSDVFQLNDRGKVKVDPYLRALPYIYVIGDNADTPYSGLAQTALHDAVFVADHLKRLMNKQPLKHYVAQNPPVVVPVGDNWAIFEWKKLRIGGFIGSLLRRAADFIGYDDLLPIGQALGVWRAQMIREEECEVCRSESRDGYHA